uniref:prephenate dehydratase n=1 Tax=uncultured marine group II/III euryarchaeote AD1000_66_E09 TaxID=1457798 RepID=A0A075G163_9EURY|nr:prephenate dehydratase (pheA2) [uncultured marine group II/III euryarchaeote AD1000_66_E09]
MPTSDFQSKRVAFLGPNGTHSEAAAVAYAPESILVAAPSITAVTEMVLSGGADEAIVPIENSLEGSVTETLDLLVHSLNLQIRHEYVLPIRHCLIARPGTRFNAIETVYSHPQAIGQCREFLQRTIPDARTEASLSTAQSVELALRNDNSAGIAPRRAAEINSAAILADGIQDDDRNSTRFVVLSDDDADPTGDDKTSIAFNVDDKPGALLTIMQQFAMSEINLLKIESRPARETLGVYIFLLDCSGHRNDEKLARVLNTIREKTVWLKIFGSYPRYS